MSYSIRRNEDGTANVIRDDGSIFATINCEIDTDLFAHACTPKLWALATVNEQAKTVTFGGVVNKTWPIRDENSRDEVVALGLQYAQELSDITGFSLAKSAAFVKWLWRFLKTAYKLLKAAGG